MATAKDLKYIRYCLAKGEDLDRAEDLLLKLIDKDKTKDGRLYALLADFSFDMDEKRTIYNKALEVDSNCPQAYWGIFTCQLNGSEYEEAKKTLEIYKNILHERDIYCNTCLLDFLLDELLGVDDQEYIVNDYYNTIRLKDEKYYLYCDIFMALQDEDYETAYEKAQIFEWTYEEIHMGLVLKLLDVIMLEKNPDNCFQKIKIEEENL